MCHVTYGVTEPLLHSRYILHPTTYLFAPDLRTQYRALVKSLEIFGWNWVGLIITPQANDIEVRELTKLMAEHEICIDFTLTIDDKSSLTLWKMVDVIEKSTVQVIVICGPYSDNYMEFAINSERMTKDITLILHESWANLFYKRSHYELKFANCSLVFMVPRNTIPKVTESIHDVNPASHPDDRLLEKIWFFLFRCRAKNKKINALYEWYYSATGVNCTETRHIPPSEYGFKDTSLYYTYVSVHILASAIDTMKQIEDNSGQHPLRHQDLAKKKIVTDRGAEKGCADIEHWIVYRMSLPLVTQPLLQVLLHQIPLKQERTGQQVSVQRQQPNDVITLPTLGALLHGLKTKAQCRQEEQEEGELQKYMKYAHYTDMYGGETFFNDRRGVTFRWELRNWVIYINEEDVRQRSLKDRHIAFFQQSEQSEDFNADVVIENMIWKNNKKMPQSRCNDPCSPGFRKAPNGGHHVCCYNCVPCADGEVSNITDSDTCQKCPVDTWPDVKKIICLPKLFEFLSYKNDALVYIFLVLSLFFSAVTLFILTTFLYYWDTPIVRANNRTVSFILLVSILLSFLCVFFFLGRPVDITCLLRQVSFGILFTIGVSSVLAKTITVCVAFKATKPGSSWNRLVSRTVSNSVVLVCSSVQVLICVIWLLVSPPYVEYNHHTYPGKIIIQCNEGSDICFYSMLGYMGLLAAVSFVLAFMVRTLPDSFNEAKYITFSMLLFCSVWIAMIPAYLSTRGKYMVAVEVFAILTSCAGVLGCIFFPKLYILYFKSELNSRNVMLEKKS
ncbi:vomeronasal type-2 receptor 26-like [Engystomops pustulosus]|uniref:vomeronasal type-2 receptor 26-like n=1 Tax=Engystomops pustulosus TaxID=76066 RepID=UPI003AFA2342